MSPLFVYKLRTSHDLCLTILHWPWVRAAGVCVISVTWVCPGQVRAAGVTTPTLLTSLQQASAAGTPAGAVAAPASTIRLTMPQQARQRSPVAGGPVAGSQLPAQVLKVMGTQPGSIPQIITLSSPRVVRDHTRSVSCLTCLESVSGKRWLLLYLVHLIPSLLFAFSSVSHGTCLTI